MATPVIMPKFGMAQEEGQVISWFIQEGQAIEEGEPLLEVMTDKVSMEVESPATGILRHVTAGPDEIVPIAEIIAYIVPPGDAWTPPEKSTRRLDQMEVSQATPQQKPSRAPVIHAATAVAQRIAIEKGVDLTKIIGSGLKGRITRQDVEAHLEKMQTPSHIREVREPPEGKVRASPAARRVARELGVELAQVSGSGPRDRIQAADVQASSAHPAILSVGSVPDKEVIPLRGVRKIIANRMTESAQNAPHISLSLHAEVTEAEAIREKNNLQLEEVPESRISFTALMVRIVAIVLRNHPWMNATFEDDGIHLKSVINIGLATAIDDGLIVPVIKNADRKELADIAAEVNDLSARARQDNLGVEDVTGGTFTISNLGMFGIETFTAILNPPETGILAIGAIIHQPVAQEGEGIVFRPMINLTLSADHRVIDGVVAARFLAEVKTSIEKPHLLNL